MNTLKYLSTTIPGGNFGDDIAHFMFAELFGDTRTRDPDIHVSLIGSLLGFPCPPCREMHIFGTGFGYQRNAWGEHCTAHFLRGPLSALFTGLSSSFYADSAYALLLSDKFLDLVGHAREHKSNRAVYIPHHSTVDSTATRTLLRCNDLTLVDPRKPWPEVIAQLAAADIVYAEAMHGAIFADIVRTPWVPVMTSRRINVFKWVDWLMGTGLDFEPVVMLSPVEARFKRRELALAATGKAAAEHWMHLFHDSEHLKFRRNVVDRFTDLVHESSLRRRTERAPLPSTGQLTSDAYIASTAEMIRACVGSFKARKIS